MHLLCHLLVAHLNGPLRLDTDTSLASLQFTESSSLEGLSLDQVVEILDKNLGDMSALDTVRSGRGRMRHSTPDRAGSAVLELVGREVKTHSRPGGGGTSNMRKAASVTVRGGGRKENKGRERWKN